MNKKTYMALAAAALLAMPASADIVEATLDLGDYENSTTVINNGQGQAPFYFYYEHSGTQVIYTSQEIASLFTNGASIKSITFRFGDPATTSWYSFTESLRCYIQLIDAEEFTVVENRSNWFKPVNASSVATATLNYDMDMMEGIEITMTFPEPFAVTPEDAGKSLLVTSESECTEGDPTHGQYFNAFTYENTARTYRVAAYYKDGSANFQERVDNGGLIYYETENSSVYRYDLPVARITYTYDTGSGVNEINADAADQEVYDLSGRRIGTSLDGVTPGIYVVRAGGKATKVAVK